MDTPPPEWQENVENFEPNGKRAILSIFRDYIFFFFLHFPASLLQKKGNWIGIYKKKNKTTFL